jgi:hypothetical protein
MINENAQERVGYAVRVTTHRLGGRAPKIWDAMFADPEQAVKAVSDQVGLADAKYELLGRLTLNLIEGLGLKPGQVKRR